MRFLFNVWSRAGHLNGSLGLARALRTAGHEVAFCCFQGGRDVTQMFCEAGLSDCSCYFPSTEPLLPTAGHQRYLEIGRRLQQRNWRQKYLERLLIYSARPQIPEILRQIGEYAPDVFCTEAVSYSGAIAAVLAGVPWATIASSWGYAASSTEPGEFAEALRDLDPARRALAQEHGVPLDFHWIEAVSPHLNLAFADERWIPRSPAMPVRTIFLGRSEPVSSIRLPFPWQRLTHDRPLVYISSGTEFRFESGVIDDLIAIALELGAQVVVTSCPADHTEQDFVTRVRYAPQDELLAKAALFVSAGGCNSIMDGLAAGVPLLLLPLGYDQPFNAGFVTKAGLGRMLDPWHWDRARVKAAIRDLLDLGVAERLALERFHRTQKASRGLAEGAIALWQLASATSDH